MVGWVSGACVTVYWPRYRVIDAEGRERERERERERKRKRVNLGRGDGDKFGW